MGKLLRLPNVKSFALRETFKKSQENIHNRIQNRENRESFPMHSKFAVYGSLIKIEIINSPT